MHQQPIQNTSLDEVDRALAALADARTRWRATSVLDRVDMAQQCAEGVVAAADDWVVAACEAKGIVPDSPTSAEDIATGPLAVLRYLRLLGASLADIERSGSPRLPGKPWRGNDSRVCVPVFPTRGLYDSLLFPGHRAEAWLPPGSEIAAPQERSVDSIQRRGDSEGVSLVLGAGNVSSIPAVDALMKLFQQNRVVLLKLNPVNDYLAGVFERAFAPLISRGFLALCQGGAEVGSYAAQHPQVDDIHITGSLAAHEAIVWGPPGPERDARKSAGTPVLDKNITSELGNVTPWIVIPGKYSQRQLDFQAENVAAMIVNNASFNCIAAKLIVTCRNWPDRYRFLDKVQAVLDGTPRRLAYYPGARKRYERFTGCQPDENPAGTLPWTLVRDVDVHRQPHFFQEESFVCVCAETALDADGAEAFLDRAVDFVNERVWGTLGVGLMVPSDLRRSAAGRGCWARALAGLRYGTIGVNAWPALAYSMMCVPWGGYPSGTLADPQSGLGWVHNTYFLEGVEKSILAAPLVVRPKPLWFPTHRHAHVLGRRVLDLYHRPAWWKLPGLIGPAMSG